MNEAVRNPERFLWFFDGGPAAYTLDAVPGSFAVTGTAATLEHDKILTADAGVFALTGTAASLEYGYEVGPDAGVFNVTGVAAALTYSGAGAAGQLAKAAVYGHPRYRGGMSRRGGRR